MIKWRICSLLAILIVLIKPEAKGQQISLLKRTYFPAYPSASGMEYFKNRLFVIGDDAAQLLVLDAEHKAVDSFDLFQSTTKRIDKDVKTDLEAAAIITNNSNTFLMLVSSFSMPQRNKIYFFPLSANKLQANKAIAVNVKSFKTAALNIEGATVVANLLLLSNRANNKQKQNTLLIHKVPPQNNFKFKRFITKTVILPPSKEVIGISGLAYCKSEDLLLFSASTEDTDDPYKDGTIGKSYIGIIYNITNKLKGRNLKADALIDLNHILNGETHKIESITVESVLNKTIIAHLASDNDNGESTLFKVRIKL